MDQQELNRRNELFNQGYWEIPEGLDTSNFNFDWRPYKHDRPYIHQFGTQHQKTGGPRFVIPEHEGIKYNNAQIAIKLPDENNRCWRPLVPNATIDYSWYPDETEPPFIYVFGNQWYDSETMPTYQYRVKGATEKKYVKDIKATLLEDKTNWEIPDNVVEFDFSWAPNPHEPPFIWQFGTQHQRTNGPKYIVENASVIKYIDVQKAIVSGSKEDRHWRQLVPNATIDYSWTPDDNEPPYIYVFGNQWYDAEIMPTYQYRVKGATEKKYINDFKATLLEDKTNWEIPDNVVEFDFSWVPNPYEPPFIWQFGTQHQRTNGPKYIVENASTIKYTDAQKAIVSGSKEDRHWRPLIPDIEFDWSWTPDDNEPPYIYVFGNQHYDAEIMPTLLYRVKGATEKKYVSDKKAYIMPNMRKWRVMEPIDKSVFDFSWVPLPEDEKYNTVFGNEYHSSEFMPTIMYKGTDPIGNKYNNTLTAKLLMNTSGYVDSLFDATISSNYIETYTHYQNKIINRDYIDIIKREPEQRYIHLIDNIEAIVPRDIKQHLNENLTDYPYVIHHNLGTVLDPLDIIFFSNGETCAEENYQHLLSLNLPNRIVHVKDIQGRVASQHVAANISNTPWYFLVNAKLKVNSNFDFNWQPNRYKSRRHYVFSATNIVNNLEYGHMAIVANNKKLTLENTGLGLDFTMDSKHEVLNINSGVAIYNSSEWDTWRTAFREVIKLCNSNSAESKERLEAWLNVGNGQFAEYSINGAKDAVEYYKEVNGEFNKLKLSYDWAWLKERFTN
jgi:hypothetical protein